MHCQLARIPPLRRDPFFNGLEVDGRRTLQRPPPPLTVGARSDIIQYHADTLASSRRQTTQSLLSASHKVWAHGRRQRGRAGCDWRFGGLVCTVLYSESPTNPSKQDWQTLSYATRPSPTHAMAMQGEESMARVAFDERVAGAGWTLSAAPCLVFALCTPRLC